LFFFGSKKARERAKSLTFFLDREGEGGGKGKRMKKFGKG
jgi:hypothetical protein